MHRKQVFAIDLRWSMGGRYKHLRPPLKILTNSAMHRSVVEWSKFTKTKISVREYLKIKKRRNLVGCASILYNQLLRVYSIVIFVIFTLSPLARNVPPQYCCLYAASSIACVSVNETLPPLAARSHAVNFPPSSLPGLEKLA